MKVAIICRNYGFSGSANAVCVNRLVEQFVNDGDTVIIFSEYTTPIEDKKTTISERLKIYRIKDDYVTVLLQKTSRFDSSVSSIFRSILMNTRRLCVGLLYPYVKPIQVQKMVRLVEKIFDNEGQADVVIGTYRPYECVDTTIKIKKKFGERICAISYHLDLISEPDFKNRLIRTYKNWRGRLAFNREKRLLDGTLVPEQVKDKRFLVGKNSYKIFHVGFPLYLTQNSREDSGVVLPADYVNVVYIGTLDNDNRYPKYCFELLEALNAYRLKNSKKAVVLRIWGNVVGEKTWKCVQTATKSAPYVQYNGSLDNAKAYDVLMKSDFLLNVGNLLFHEMVPSKIFQLFSTKKPIINVVRHKDDASLTFFEKYKFYLPVCEYAEPDNLVEKLSDFIDTNIGKTASVSDETFEKNKPEFITNLVRSIKNNVLR